jgi:hypothetical protein
VIILISSIVEQEPQKPQLFAVAELECISSGTGFGSRSKLKSQNGIPKSKNLKGEAYFLGSNAAL